MEQYLLSPHVHLCLTDDHAVLLDLRRDKYIGIPRNQLPNLAASIKGWPSSSSSSPSPPLRGGEGRGEVGSSGSLAQMLSVGILTTDPTIGKEARPPALPRPETTLTEPDLDSRASPSAGQIANFLRARITARLLLKWRPIESVVARAQARKLRQTANPKNIDPEQARHLVDSFLYLRPLLFGTRDECLYDSLSLIEFLSYYRLHPTWVFGVQTRPFLAHSWVQEESAVLNDTPDYVRRFTPILTV